MPDVVALRRLVVALAPLLPRLPAAPVRRPTRRIQQRIVRQHPAIPQLVRQHRAIRPLVRQQRGRTRQPASPRLRLQLRTREDSAGIRRRHRNRRLPGARAHQVPLQLPAVDEPVVVAVAEVALPSVRLAMESWWAARVA